MRGWVRGDPLSRVIAEAIQHQVKVGYIVFPDYSDRFSFKKEIFDASNVRQVNFVIDEVMKDLETGLRFRILRYLQNYFDLSLSALGIERTGINLALAVEYGTIDVRAIELQDLGFGRSVSLELLNNYSDAFQFEEDGDLRSFDQIRFWKVRRYQKKLRARLGASLKRNETLSFRGYHLSSWCGMYLASRI